MEAYVTESTREHAWAKSLGASGFREGRYGRNVPALVKFRHWVFVLVKVVWAALEATLRKALHEPS